MEWTVTFPIALAPLRALCVNHHALVTQSRRCGCFYCGSIFDPKEIRKWADHGRTALCPRCGVDAVLPERGLTKPLSEDLLNYLFDASFVGTVDGRPTVAARPLIGAAETRLSVDPPQRAREPVQALLVRLGAMELATDAELRARVWRRTPKARAAGAGLMTIAALLANSSAAGMVLSLMAVLLAAMAWRRDRNAWALARRALHAMRMGRWGASEVAHALGRPDADWGRALPGGFLHQEAEDWVRAFPELEPLWRAWNAPPRRLRNVDVRRFLDEVRRWGGNAFEGHSDGTFIWDSAHGPYTDGEPL